MPTARMHRLRLIALWSALLSSQLTAQRIIDVTAGTTVRIRQGTPTIAVIRGTLLSADTVQVVVGRDQTAIRRIPYQEITSFEYLVSRRTIGQARTRGMLYGVGAGLGATAVMFLGTIVAQRTDGDTCTQQCWLTTRGATRAGIALTVTTTVLGALVFQRHTERWRPVRLPWS